MNRRPPDVAGDRGDRDLAVGQPAAVAAGLGGVAHSIEALRRQMGWRRAARTMLAVNQIDGIDCPGCAWPEPAHGRSHVEFCENGAKAIAEEATERRCGPELFAQHSIASLRERSDHWLGQQGRLTEPMVARPGDDHYRPVSWDEAVDAVATALRRTPDPDRAVFYTSGRTSNEAAFLYQLFVRRYGTNNLPDCSNMCHESSGAALGQTIGIGKGSVSLEDFTEADLIVVVGQNPGTNHPRMLSALESAKRGGARIVSVNPLPEAGLLRFKNPQKVRGLLGRGTSLSDLHLPIRVGADMALFQYLGRAALDAGAVDRDFVDAHCEGADELCAHLGALDPDALVAATGLQRGDLDRLAGWVCDTDRIIVCWAMGLTQHRQAVATIREIVNLVLLRGAIGIPGAGLCPVRGHSNVQGDRTMGIHEKPAAQLLDRLGERFGFDPPRRSGHDTVDAIGAMARGEVDVLVSMGGNLVSAAPDTDATTAAVDRVGTVVSVSTKLNRTHLHGSGLRVILPCLGRTERHHTTAGEQFVTVEDSMSMVHASRGRLEPASPHLRSEPAIVAALAAATLGPDDDIDWVRLGDDLDVVRDHIEAVIDGFDDFNARVRRPGGFVLPHPPRDERRFHTASGRAQLTVNHFEPVEVPEGRLLLQTLRSHDQYNTTIYGLDDRYRGISGGRRVVLCHGDDLARHGLVDGDLVDIVSEWRDGVERRAPRFRVVEYPLAVGTCAAYFPEANVLVPLDSVAEVSNTPTSKAVVVRLDAAT